MDSLLIQPSRPRIQPAWWYAIIAFLIVQVWMNTFPGSFLSSGVRLSEVGFGDNLSTVGFTVKVAIVGVFVALVITLAGWWQPVLRDNSTPRRWWTLAVLLPGVVALVGIVYLATTRTVPAILMVVLVMLVVAVTEELLYRGLIVTGLRGSRLPEWAVWLLSTLIFSSVHFGNLLSGAPIDEVLRQVPSTFITGSFLYAARLLSGNILIPIVMHLVFNVLVGLATEETAADSMVFISGISVQIGTVAALLGLPTFFIIRGLRERRRASGASPTA